MGVFAGLEGQLVKGKGEGVEDVFVYDVVDHVMDLFGWIFVFWEETLVVSTERH